MDKQTVLKVAKLARLKVDDTRATEMADRLSSLFDWIEQLQAVNTDGVEPMTNVSGQAAFRRGDVANDGFKQADILANAPDAAEGFFVVPKVVE